MSQANDRAVVASLGSRSEVVVLPNRQAVSRAAAQRFVELAQHFDPFTVALSGGSTPRLLYEVLAQPPARDQVPWAQVHLFWGDERCVPPDHADSNYRLARETLIDRVAIPLNNVHRIRGELPPDDAAALYRTELGRLVGAADPLGLVLLGMGADGHTASLFPESPALEEQDRTVVAVYAEHLRSWRVTLTLPTINQARNVLFLVSGDSKIEAVQQVFRGAVLPAAKVHPANGRLTWLLDQEAARGLDLPAAAYAQGGVR